MLERRTTSVELQARAAARCAGFAPPPKVELPSIGPRGLRELYFSGGDDFDRMETGLVMSARIEGPLELAIAEGLLALTVGDGLLQVGLRLDDYAREVLDVEPGTAMKRVRLARRLRTRPILREAIRRGEVSIRAAEVVALVATGEAEAEWVRRASTETVRALEQAVKAARPALEAPEADDEEFGRLTVRAKPEQLPVIDMALEVAAQELPGSKRFEQLEAIAQEWLGGHPDTVPESDPRPLCVYRAFAPGESAAEARKEQLERETERWRTLDDVPPWKEPDLRWKEVDTAEEADATLRQLAEHRRDWDERVGWIGHELARGRMWATMGFATFRHYVEERLGLPPRAVEQRARLEERIRKSPALEEARAEGLSYERLRALARLAERDIPEWLPRAKELTVIALREALDARDAGQMRTRGLFGANVPERVARLVTAAFESVRATWGELVDPGRCLAIMSQHFLDTHGPPKKPKTSSQKVRARDHGRCSVPGCSHPAVHSHHITYRSQGGARTDPSNQTALCAFHHTCVHDGYMSLVGAAPGRLQWELRPWRGRQAASTSA